MSQLGVAMLVALVVVAVAIVGLVAWSHYFANAPLDRDPPR